MSGSRYKAYPKYRESDVEWLDFVPNHWKSVPLKYMALSDGALFLDGDWIESKDLAEDGIRYITTGNVGEGAYKEQGAGFISEAKFKQLNCSEVFAGDVLISRLNLPIGRACVVPPHETRIVTSVDNVIFRPDGNFAKEFLVYLFSSAEYFLHTSNLARGATMQRISRGLLGNVRASIPPLPEQTQIAAFLDHETAKIDRLIEKQQGLIALLKEKRQAVISHAVTQGLNPHAPLKDSGIEWLGQVPAHWAVKKLGYLCSIQTGERDTEHAVEEGIYPFFVRSQTIERINSTSFDCEAVLTAGDGAGVGKVFHHYTGPFDFHQRVYMMNNFHGVSGRFFFHYFRELFYRVALEGGAKSTVDSLRRPMLTGFPVCVPPVSEQNAIIRSVEEKSALFDFLTTKAEQGIILLQERRTALISAAVTGKIDVRAWQPPSHQPIEANSA